MSSNNDRKYYSDTEDETPISGNNSQRQTNVYVKDFDNRMNESKLCELFAKYGTITSCKIAKDEFNRSKGFGFVNFLTPSMAEKAIKNLNGSSLDNGKKLCVCFFQTKADREREKQLHYNNCQDRNLFIGNLDESIDDQKLRNAFAEYGTIISAKVQVENGRSKCYGFVCFRTAEEASEAINGMNRKKLSSMPIYVALCKSQNKRSQSSNPRVRSISTSRDVFNRFELPLTPSNKPPPSIIRFSNRLPIRVCRPNNQ